MQGHTGYSGNNRTKMLTTTYITTPAHTEQFVRAEALYNTKVHKKNEQTHNTHITITNS